MNISSVKIAYPFKSNKELWVCDNYKELERRTRSILPENCPYEASANDDTSKKLKTPISLANQAKVQIDSAKIAQARTQRKINFDKFLKMIDRRAGSDLVHTLDRKLLAQSLTDVSMAPEISYDNGTLAIEGREVIKNTFSDILDEFSEPDLESQPAKKMRYLKRLTSDRQLNLLAKKYALDELVLKDESYINKYKTEEINARAFCAFIGAIAQSNPSCEIQEYFWNIFSDLVDEEVYGVACYEDMLNDFIAVYGNDEDYGEFYSKENDKIRATLIYKDKILASNVGKDRDSAYTLACESAYRKLKNGKIEISRKPVFE